VQHSCFFIVCIGNSPVDCPQAVPKLQKIRKGADLYILNAGFVLLRLSLHFYCHSIIWPSMQQAIYQKSNNLRGQTHYALFCGNAFSLSCTWTLQKQGFCHRSEISDGYGTRNAKMSHCFEMNFIGPRIRRTHDGIAVLISKISL
jgi:hypothetical protein